MENIECCKICGNPATEEHHIIKRSQARFLVNCKLNKVRLCVEHHRGQKGVHSKNGHKLDYKLRLDFQNNLEILLDKQYFNKEDIKNILEVNENSVNSLCKLMQSKKGMFSREDIIKACLGGKMIVEGE